MTNDTKPLVLGLGGYATAGKDAVADVLEREHGWARTTMSKPFAQALYDLNPLIPIVRGPWESTPEGMRPVNHYARTSVTGPGESVIHVDYRTLHEAVGYDESKTNPEVRRLLQALGTEVGRRLFGNSVWADLMLKEVAVLGQDGHNVVVTGLRFPDEFEAIHSIGGICVWVNRPGTNPVNAHASDNSLSEADFDLTLHNDGTLEDLEQRVSQLLRAARGLDATADGLVDALSVETL